MQVTWKLHAGRTVNDADTLQNGLAVLQKVTHRVKK